LLDYSRNKVRHEIIPQLALLNPQVITLLSESANRLRTDEAFLQREALELLAAQIDLNAGSANGSLSVPAVFFSKSIWHYASGLFARSCELSAAICLNSQPTPDFD